MCKVNCEVENGLIPSEKVARVTTADGRTEEVVVSNRQIMGGTLIASQIGEDGDRVLVELPRESSSGRWRIWVNKDQLGG